MNPGPVRVLLVDDHPVVRDGLAALLGAEADLDVVGTAADGRPVPDLVAATGPDLVITDLRMPGGDGVALLVELSRRHPLVPVLVLSTFADPDEVAAALDAGAASYLLKDTDRHELVAAVRETARGGSVLSPAVTAEVLRARRDRDRPTPRERQILELVAAGRTNQQIARALRISQATVKTHLSQLFTKLAAPDRAAAVAAAARRGWLDLSPGAVPRSSTR